MNPSAKKNNVKNEIVILTATSGDTGKAALAGFANVPGTKIIVFYPKNGVSPIQEKQMVTQKGGYTYVIGIKGNFDDAQTGVKNIFSDKELEKVMNDAGFQFSSANSINIGRLVPQIVYYVYAYAKLLANGEIKDGEKINVVVPTGNFGNILAAFYAKNMGLPINKFICASNENKVLYDFFTTGEYDRNREFVLTTSPSMDILISSNLERLIYRIAGNNAAKNAELMASLKSEGKYKITDDMKAQLADFYGNYATEAEDAPQEDRRPCARPVRQGSGCLYRGGRLFRPRVLRYGRRHGEAAQRPVHHDPRAPASGAARAALSIHNNEDHSPKVQTFPPGCSRLPVSGSSRNIQSSPRD